MTDSDEEMEAELVRAMEADNAQKGERKRAYWKRVIGLLLGIDTEKSTTTDVEDLIAALCKGNPGSLQMVNDAWTEDIDSSNETVGPFIKRVMANTLLGETIDINQFAPNAHYNTLDPDNCMYRIVRDLKERKEKVF